MKTTRTLISILAFLFCLGLSAQDMKQMIKERPELSAGYYRSYDEPAADDAAVTRPDGYVPFYISHYGRHGSRWHSSDRIYNNVLSVLEKASAADALTDAGQDFLAKARIAAADAEGRYGDLSPRGTREHKGIAARMYRTYPEVFEPEQGSPAKIDSKSTVVVRCILSMAAFNESLKELQPDLEMTRESSQRNMCFIGNHEHSNANNVFRRAGAVSDSLRNAWIAPQRFIKSLFSDRKFVKENIRNTKLWMYDAFLLAGILQDVDYLDLDLYEHFTDDELYSLWKCINAYAYMTMGPSLRFGDYNMDDAKPLLKDIVTCADQVIAGKSDLSASLRFGHDSNVIPLLCLMGVEDIAVRVDLDDVAENWNLSMVSPMATNVQFIFFRNDAGNVKVRVMHNEHDAPLPVEGAPFYDWKDLRKYLSGKYEN